MKRIIQYVFILSILIFSSCKKEENSPFAEPIDVRIGNTMGNLQKTLVSAKDGWNATLYTKAGGGFSFWLKFNDSNRVWMISGFNATTTAKNVGESSFRLKALQQPTLIFDTYSYIHLLADPDGNVNGGTNGSGLTSDFEFYLDKGAIEKLKDNAAVGVFNMIGRYNETVLHLKKATSAEAAAYASGKLASLMDSISNYLSNNPNLYVQFADGVKVQVSIDLLKKSLNLGWINDNQVQNQATKYAFNLTGLTIQDTLMYKDNSILSFWWDAGKNKLAAVLSNGEKVYLQSSLTPIIPLYFLLGNGFDKIYIPRITTFPGWSPDFINRRAQAAYNIKHGGYNLDLGQIELDFNVEGKTVNITVDIFQNGSRYIATFPYAFNMTAAGIFKFTPQSGRNTNANSIVADMAPLFQERLDADTFVMEYYVDPTYGTLAKMVSIEHPDFYFTGVMQ